MRQPAFCALFCAFLATLRTPAALGQVALPIASTSNPVQVDLSSFGKAPILGVFSLDVPLV